MIHTVNNNKNEEYTLLAEEVTTEVQNHLIAPIPDGYDSYIVEFYTPQFEVKTNSIVKLGVDENGDRGGYLQAYTTFAPGTFCELMRIEYSFIRLDGKSYIDGIITEANYGLELWTKTKNSNYMLKLPMLDLSQYKRINKMQYVRTNMPIGSYYRVYGGKK